MADFSVSQSFYKIRGCAIISVAYAHSAPFSNVVLDNLSSLLGIIGVPLFLIASGYYFRKQTWLEFFSNKLHNIVCPWIIWGTVAFVLSCIALGGDVTIKRYVSYMIGYGTWLYYVPIYIIITVTFNFLSSRLFLISSLFFSLVSCMLSYYNIYEYTSLTPYLNPFNWIGFYALGVLLKTINIKSWAENRAITVVLLVLCVVLLSFIAIHFQMKICYWNPICFVIELLCFFLISNICTRLKNDGLLVSFGRYSFLIYFLHMQFGIYSANLIFSVVEVSEIAIFVLKPLVVILITYAYVRILTYFVCLFGLEKFSRYLGIPVK